MDIIILLPFLVICSSKLFDKYYVRAPRPRTANVWENAIGRGLVACEIDSLSQQSYTPTDLLSNAHPHYGGNAIIRSLALIDTSITVCMKNCRRQDNLCILATLVHACKSHLSNKSHPSTTYSAIFASMLCIYTMSQ